jgi:hypothetical protein
VLTNPGQIPSGRVAIISDNNRFETKVGDFKQGDPARLVDGGESLEREGASAASDAPQARVSSGCDGQRWIL